MSLEAIKYVPGSLQLLDQRLLPHEFTYLDVRSPEDGWQHIKDMVVRGAPAIGVTGVLTIAVDLVSNKAAGAAFGSAGEALEYVRRVADYMVTSRPTAVNLADGLDKVKAAATAASAAPDATAASVVQAVVSTAEAYFKADVACNKAIGQFGAQRLLEEVAKRRSAPRASGGVRVLTHCNTGSLATAGYGTALGIIRALHAQGKLEHAYCTETRPYNQGARLTAYELTHDGIPATLVCDSATAYLMESGEVDAVAVGADRVVANGDTANKIGTYMLSVIASHHGVPFFVAAPTTTLDPELADGKEIEIEQRPPTELTHFRGTQVVTDKIQVWNPSFDVAPGRLITAIVTELGVVPVDPNTYTHEIRSFMAKHALLASNGNGVAAHATRDTPRDDGFYALDPPGVVEYVAARPELCKQVGPANTKHTWAVKEVGDGNINFVYIVEGPTGGLAVKQSLPYVRCVGESWPLTQDRVRIEAEALGVQGALDAAHVPVVHVYDARMAVIAMQYLAPPAIILRHGMNQGRTYPQLADHLSTFLARTLFGTSLLALPSDKFRAQQVQFNNPEMCALTETVIFVEPYITHPNNRHTDHPAMHAAVAQLRSDPAAKVAIARLKRQFMTHGEALLHGDLHTGSVMVTPESTWVIDPEFAFVGPMAFDVAKILANLVLALFASRGQEAQAQSSRAKSREWIVSTVRGVWHGFVSKFLDLWRASTASSDTHTGHLFASGLLAIAEHQGASALEGFQQDFMNRLWTDTVAFMGAFIVRRLVGIAHVADMDGIANVNVRAMCEVRALQFGQQLLGRPTEFTGVDQLVAAAEDVVRSLSLP